MDSAPAARWRGRPQERHTARIARHTIRECRKGRQTSHRDGALRPPGPNYQVLNSGRPGRSSKTFELLKEQWLYLGTKVKIIRIVIVGIIAGRLGAQDVAYVRDGRIWVSGSDGRATELTAGPRDSQPSISSDGKVVVFCRIDPSDDFRTEIYSVRRSDHSEYRLFSGPVHYRGQEIRYLGWPALDASGHTLFLIARHSVTTGALFSIDLPSGTERYLTDGAEFAVVRSGPNAGKLLVNQRFTDQRVARYEWWLFTSDGERIRLVTRERLQWTEALRLVGDTRGKTGKPGTSMIGKSQGETEVSRGQ